MLQALFKIEGYPVIFQRDNGKEFLAEILSSFLRKKIVLRFSMEIHTILNLKIKLRI